MKISIITAAFRASLMDRVWESIKNQIHKDWELIIVNDGQEEIRNWYAKNIEKMRSVNPRIWFVDIEKHKGRFGLYSRNVGAMLASYSRIVYHDDDNQWEKDHLSSLVQLEENTGRIPYCWMHLFGKKPGSTYEKIKKTGFSKQGIDLGCLIWRKEFFKKYGYFLDERQVTFDWMLIQRVFEGEGKNAFVCTRKPSLRFFHKRY